MKGSLRQFVGQRRCLLLTVHNSVLLEVPEDRAESASRLVRRFMQSPPPGFTVPLAVAVSCGRCWAECR